MSIVNQVSQLYIGILGRAADRAGLEYWVQQVQTGKLTIEGVAKSFQEQPEWINGNGQLDRPGILNELYKNLFGREATGVDKAYWVLGEGASVPLEKLVLALIAPGAALGNDAIVLAQRTDAAVNFSFSDADTTDLEAAAAVITGVNGGSTFTLTTNQDAIVGTSGNDTIVAVVDGVANTLTLGDSINGGNGTDTLKVTTDQDAINLAIATITSVENFVADVRGEDFDTLNLANNAFASVTVDFNNQADQDDTLDINSVNKASNLTIQNHADFDGYDININYVGSGAINNSLVLKNLVNAEVNVDVNQTKAEGTFTLTLDGVEDVDFYTDLVQTLNVVVASESTGVEIMNYSSFTATESAVVNLTLNADLQAYWWDLPDSGKDTTFNITGAGNVTIDELDDYSSKVTVNGGTATGNIDITFGTDDVVSVTTGSGDDRIVLDNDYFVADSELVVALGAGSNTLGISDVTGQAGIAALDFSDVTLSGVTALEFVDDIVLTADATLDLDGVGAVSKLVFADIDGNWYDLFIDNAAETFAVEANDTFTEVYLYLDGVKNLDLSATGVVNVELDDVATGYNNLLETVTITSAEDDVYAYIYDLAKLKNLTITADAENENDGWVYLNLNGAPELLTVTLTAGDYVYAYLGDAAKLTTVTVVAGDDDSVNYLELVDTPKVTMIDLSGLTDNDDSNSDNAYIYVDADSAAFAQAVTIKIGTADVEYYNDAANLREVFKFVGDNIGNITIDGFVASVGANGDRLDFSSFAGVDGLEDLDITFDAIANETTITSDAFDGTITIVGVDASVDAFNYTF